MNGTKGNNRKRCNNNSEMWQTVHMGHNNKQIWALVMQRLAPIAVILSRLSPFDTKQAPSVLGLGVKWGH